MTQWKFYHIWMTKLTELRPGERVTRLRNFTWLLVGMYSAQAVHLSKVAAKMPGLSCLPSRTRRLSRLLDNPAIQTRRLVPTYRAWDSATPGRRYGAPDRGWKQSWFWASVVDGGGRLSPPYTSTGLDLGAYGSRS